MSTIYVVMGYSNSGKDTIGAYLKEYKLATVVKFAAPGKRALEFMLKVEPGFLDDRVKRQQVAPHCQGRTYLQVLIDFWKHKNLVVGKDLFTSQTMEKVDYITSNDRDVVITDVRSFDEMEALKKFLLINDDVLLDVTWVNRRAAQKLESDQYQQAIFQELSNVSEEYRFINNHGTYAELTKVLQDTFGQI